MDDRPDLEPTQDVEDALRKLFRQPDPDPAFVADLERRLRARPQRQTRLGRWGQSLLKVRQQLWQQVSSWAPVTAWSAVAILLVLGLVWTLDIAMPRPEFGGAQTPSLARVTSTPTGLSSPSMTPESRSASSEALGTPQASGQATDPTGADAAGHPSAPLDASDPYNRWRQYTNQDYGFSFRYPPGWVLEETPHRIRLSRWPGDTLVLSIGFKRSSEDVGVRRSAGGAGEAVTRGSVAFLGQEVSRDVLVYQNREKAVQYNYGAEIRRGDGLLFTLSLEDLQTDYGEVSIPAEVQLSADRIVASFELLSAQTGWEAGAAGPGKLAFVRGGNIWVQALPDELPQRLTSGGGHRRPHWSPSGNFLAFYKGSSQVWVWRADGQGSQALNNGGRVSAFAWSPSRDWLAYIAGDGELRLADGSGRDLRVLVRPSGSKSIPRLAWSPAGDWIAFQLVRARPEGQPPEVSLWKISIDGAGPLQLYTPPSSAPSETALAPTGPYPLLAGWTGDGRSLLFWDGDESFSASLLADGVPLAILPAGGGDPHLLAEAVLVHEDFVLPDPSGTARVAVVTGGPRETWTGKMLSVIAGQDRALITSPEAAASSPAWSPDGMQIAYAAAPDAGQVSGEEARLALSQRRIWLRNFRTGEYRRLTSDPEYRDEAPLWSADGEWLLFVRLGSREAVSLWLVPAAGGDPRQVVDALDGPAGGTADPWFGYYGHLDWGEQLDWWR